MSGNKARKTQRRAHAATFTFERMTKGIAGSLTKSVDFPERTLPSLLQ
jgi:hypothetical protein